MKINFETTLKTGLTIGLLVVLVSLNACATIFSDNADEVSFESEPTGAKVYMGSNLLGTTPMKVRVPRQIAATFLLFKKEGYHTKEIQMNKGIASSAFLNLFFLPTTCGATSWGIDAVSGKMFKYNPEAYVVELNQAEASSPSDSALGFVIENEIALRSEIARGKSALLENVCRLRQDPLIDCPKRVASLDRKKLLQSSHALALYRALGSS